MGKKVLAYLSSHVFMMLAVLVAILNILLVIFNYSMSPMESIIGYVVILILLLLGILVGE